MKCTRFKKGYKLNENNIEEVVSELRKDYPYASNEDLDVLARDGIILHNRAEELKKRLNNTLRYYEDGKYKNEPITDIDINLRDEITVTLPNKTVRFKADLQGNIKGEGTIHSDDFFQTYKAMHNYRGDVYFNRDIGTRNDIEKVFGTEFNFTVDNIMNTRAAMVELDQKQNRKYYDPEHSKYLGDLVEKMYSVNQDLSKVKVKVTKDTLDLLSNEPLGSYMAKDEPEIALGLSQIEDLSKNRLIMTNEEALVHESFHAFSEPLFNNDFIHFDTKELRDNINNLYEFARENLTYEDLLNTLDNPTEYEKQVSKDIFNYIFAHDKENPTKRDFDKGLHEFMTYIATNKYFKQAVDNLKTNKNSYKRVKPKSETVVGDLVLKIVDFIKRLFTKNVTTLSDQKLGDEVLRLTFKLANIHRRYSLKAKEESKGLSEKSVTNILNQVTDTADKKIKETINTTFKSLGLSKDKADIEKEARDFLRKQNIPEVGIEDIYKRFGIKENPYKDYGGVVELYNLHYHLKVLKDLNLEDPTLGIIEKTINNTKAIYALSRVMLAMYNAEGDAHENILGDIFEGVLTDTQLSVINQFKKFIFDFKEGSKTFQEITDLALEINSKVFRIRDLYHTTARRTLVDAFTTLDITSRENTKYRKVLHSVVLRADLQAITTDSKKLYKLLTDDNALNNEISKYEPSEAKDYKRAKDMAEYLINKKGLKAVPNNLDEDKLVSLLAIQKLSKEERDTFAELITKDPNAVSYFLDMAKSSQNSLKKGYKTFYKGARFEPDNLNLRLVEIAENKAIPKEFKVIHEYVDGTSVAVIPASYAGVYVSGTLATQSKISQVMRTDGLKDGRFTVREELQEGGVSYGYSIPDNIREEVFGEEFDGIDSLSQSLGLVEEPEAVKEMNEKLAKKLIKISDEIHDKIKKGHVVKQEFTHVKPSNINGFGSAILGVLSEYITEDKSKNLKSYEGLYIPNDIITQLVGHGDISLLSDDGTVASFIDNKLPELTKKVSPTTAKIKLRKAERFLVDVIGIMKNNIVIKMPSTVIGNILSNAKFLFYKGIPPKRALELLALSKKSLAEYHELEREEALLDMELTRKTNKKLEVKKELIKRKKERNPLHPLMVKGLYQNIVEDYLERESDNEIVKYVEGKLEGVTSKFPQSVEKNVNEVINTLFLTRKSEAGKALLGLTKESDFHFRAALYLYSVEKGETNSKAMRRVIDDFINYSRVISSPIMLYLDRIGVEPFYKYFAFIQRRTISLVKRKTSKAIIDTVLTQGAGIPQGILDSNVIYRLGKRFDITEYPTRPLDLVESNLDIPILNFLRSL